MTVLNREGFLEHIAENLGRPRRTEGVERPEWSLTPQWEVLRGATQDELVDVLEKQCQVIHTDFVRTDKDGLGSTLREVLNTYNGKTIVAANDSRNETYGLTLEFEKLQSEGKVVHLWNPELGEENRMFAERADVGITFSDVTLAESGTVTLFMDQHNGRSISLLPRTYIAIIPKSTIVPRMTQAAKLIHDAARDVPSCISFITGPSNSADIEMNLIVGVHGPVQVTYIVVE